jgi:hypothetical protein
MTSNIPKIFYNLVKQGFENYYNFSGTCQFLISGEQATAFAITVAGKGITFSEGLYPSPTATVEMAASYFEIMVINNCTIDFDVPEFYSSISCTGDKYFALELARSIIRPHPAVESKFKQAEQLTGLSELTEIDRIERPSAALVAEKISQGIPIIATHCLTQWETESTNLDELESVFGSITVKAKPSQKINTVADLLAHMKNPPDPAGGFSKMTILSEAEKLLFPTPEFLNGFNISGAPQLWTASASPERPVTKMHRDGSTGFLGHIFGRKKLNIYSPDQSKYLYPKKAYNIAQPCWVDIVNSTEDIFPNYRHARPIEVILQPGEMLIQPTGWFHSVYALDPVMSVSYFVMDEVHRPPAPRLAMKTSYRS